MTNLIHELDAIEQQEILQQLKSSGKKRIPVHIGSKINPVNSPSLLSIQSQLQKGESELAWKMFDQLATQMAQQSIPHSTTHQLLVALHDLVNTNSSRLLLHFCKLQDLYFSRLESLAGVIRRNKDAYWDKDELALALDIYGKLNQVKRAESLFKNMAHYTLPGTSPSVSDYNQLLTVYLRKFKHIDPIMRKRYLSKTHTLMQEMIRKGLNPSTHTYNLILAAQVKAHDLQGAEKLFSQMTVKPDLDTFHILLNGYLKAGRTKKDQDIVQVWMERLLDSGNVPNRKTFYSVMDGLAEQAAHASRTKNQTDIQSTVQSISHLYQVMLQAGHQPDTDIVNTLLKCYTAAHDIEGIEKIMNMLELPEKKGGCGNCGNCGCGGGGKKELADVEPVNKEVITKVKPDRYTFNMLIKHHLAQDQSDQAFQMYDTMVNSKLEPDTVTYSNFIWYYAKQGNINELLRYVDVMQKKDIPYNDYIYNILLNCSLQYPSEAGLLEPHLRSMAASGCSTLDSVSRNTQLSRLQVDERDNLDNSFTHFTDVLDRNINAAADMLDTRTYNTVLQSAGQFYKIASKQKEHRYLSDTLDDIIFSLDTSHLTPDLYTYALGIRNASYIGHMEKAESIYKSMVDIGVKPNEYVFSHLIYGYSSIGKVEKAQELLELMVNQYQLKPNAINYAPIIKGFAEAVEYDKAYKLFRDMLDKNITADLVIYTILASVFLKSPVRGNEKRAIELLEGIEKGGVTLDAAALTTLAEAYALEAKSILCYESVGQKKSSSELIATYTQKLDSIYSRLKEKKWIDAKAMTTLLSAYGSFNNPEATWKLWNDLKSDTSLQFSTYHYNAAIHGLTASKAWFPVAKMIYEEMHHNPSTLPNAQTFDSIIWGAYDVSDYETIRNVCYYIQDRESPSLRQLHVRTYYATLLALLDNNEVDMAKRVFEEYRKLPLAPNSTTVWVGLIKKLALHNGLEK